MAHVHAVDTRPSFPLPPIRRPGDEASDRVDTARQSIADGWVSLKGGGGESINTRIIICRSYCLEVSALYQLSCNCC